jgi:hypothetical protein
VYRLLVDPERIEQRDNVRGWILDILVKSGGRVTRAEMVKKFTATVRRKRPELTMRPTSLLSTHQRSLRDEGLIQILEENGSAITTRRRPPLKGK